MFHFTRRFSILLVVIGFLLIFSTVNRFKVHPFPHGRIPNSGGSSPGSASSISPGLALRQPFHLTCRVPFPISSTCWETSR